MKKIEIKSVNTKSAFKATVFMNLFTMGLMFLVGLILLLVGILLGNVALLGMGIGYLFMPVIGLGLSGLINMVNVLIYSKLAQKYGGLELDVEESNK